MSAQGVLLFSRVDCAVKAGKLAIDAAPDTCNSLRQAFVTCQFGGVLFTPLPHSPRVCACVVWAGTCRPGNPARQLAAVCSLLY